MIWKWTAADGSFGWIRALSEDIAWNRITKWAKSSPEIIEFARVVEVQP
jgi:hypothetical protein